MLLFGTRPVTPDYVLLADRESPRDHLPVVAQALSRRFAEEGVAAAAYDYFGDPRRLRRAFPAQEEAEISIDRLAGRHAGARLLLLAEPAHCLDSTGRPQAWLDELPEEAPVLLDPRGERCWDWREEQIEGAGVRVFPASPSGIGAYADTVQARADGPRQRCPADSRGLDLPTMLDRHRTALLQEAAPDEWEIRDLLDDLELWLGREAMTVLRAAAVFPLVEPALTLLLASRLRDEEGKSLLTEDRLLALARLPWMRVGRIPRWLRGPLARSLEPGQLEIVAGTIHAFLTPVPDGPKGRLKLDFSQADDPAAREQLLDWLRRNPASPYSDALLIDAVAGRPPNELALDPEAGFAAVARRTLKAIDIRRDGLALLVSLLLIGGEVLFRPAAAPNAAPAEHGSDPPSAVQANTESNAVATDEPAEVQTGGAASAPKPAKGDDELTGADVTKVDPTGSEDGDPLGNAIAAAACDEPRAQKGIPKCSFGRGRVLATVPIADPARLSGLMFALDRAAKSLQPSEAERLDVAVLWQPAESGEIDARARMVEAFVGKRLSVHLKSTDYYRVYREEIERNPKAPVLAVRIVRLRLTDAAAD